MILCTRSTPRSSEQSTKHRSCSESMQKVCLFYSQNNKIVWLSNVADIFGKMYEVRKGLWDFLIVLSDWLGRQTLITWQEDFAEHSYKFGLQTKSEWTVYLLFCTSQICQAELEGSLWSGTKGLMGLLILDFHTNTIIRWPCSKMAQALRVLLIACKIQLKISVSDLASCYKWLFRTLSIREHQTKMGLTAFCNFKPL